MHHEERETFVCVCVSYFATWVPIITSPSFMRTVLNGLERETWNFVCILDSCIMFFFSSSCVKTHLILFTSCMGRHWETPLPRGPLKQQTKNVNANSNNRCFFFCAWLSGKYRLIGNMCWLNVWKRFGKTYPPLWARGAPPLWAQSCCPLGSHQSVWTGSTS